MPRTQKKNSIWWLVAGLLLTYLGEGILGLSIYWIALMALSEENYVYYFALGLGVLASLMTATPLGLTSFILILWLLVYQKLLTPLQQNFWVIILWVLLGNLAVDLATHTNFGLGEVVANVALTIWYYRQAGHTSELRLRS